MKRVSVVKQDGERNISFRDNFTKDKMTCKSFVSKIETGKYDKYHVRVINGIKTPVSNPDKSKNNNLG